MKARPLLLGPLLALMAFPGASALFADTADGSSDASSAAPADASSDTSTVTAANTAISTGLAPNGLTVHKPLIDPTWGRLIQYHEDQVAASPDKAAETTYTFVFQDDKGVVRVCVYHESPDSTGYWEISVWDQP